jgi:hypothetical protein
MAVPHPFDQTLSGDPPYAPERTYWDTTIDWTWTFENGSNARFRDYTRTISWWFDALTHAGFTVERLIEPYQGDVTRDDTKDFLVARARVIPYVLILKARKR